MELVVSNSFCYLKSPSPKVEATVAQVLTYENEIEAEKAQIFRQMQILKQYGVKKKKGETKAEADARAKKQLGLCKKKLKDLEDNKVVCWYDNGKFPTGHLNIVKATLEHLKAPYTLADKRDVPTPDLILKWNNKPFAPRYYQKEAIDLATNAGRGVIVSAVGTGKSLMMAYILKNVSVNSLIIVPSRGLSDQLYNDFAIWFGKTKVQIIDTKAVRSGKVLKPIRIVTIQSLASLQESGELQNLIGDINAVFVDEIHHAGAKSYTNLLTEMSHIYYRFGFTGTFLRNDMKVLDMWGFLSNVLYSYPAHKAIAEGFLTPLVVKRYNLAGKASRSYQKEYDNNYCGNKELIQQVVNICREIPADKQILILVSRKDKSGKIFHEVLNQLGILNSYVSGDDKKEVISQMISDFNDKKIQILIGSSVIGEGIDVRATDHLIMCQGGKSEITIVQATGRAIRLYEGKETAYVHDFNFLNTKYMEKHFNLRMNIYERNFSCQFVDVN